MKKSIYQSIKDTIRDTREYEQKKKAFVLCVQKGIVGLAEQEPSGQDMIYMAEQNVEALILSESPYAQYLIALAALEDTLDELKNRIGVSGYLDEIYLPWDKVTGCVLPEETCLSGIKEEEAKSRGKQAFHLDADYELECELEFEINRLAERSLYRKVIIASKLENAAGLAG